MPEPAPPTTPPPAGDEVATLRGFLDRQRDLIRRKTEGLTSAELNRPLPPSTMTLGGLLKHLAVVEHSWLTEVFLGLELAEPWASVDWDADVDWDWHSAADDSPEELRALFDSAAADSDRIIEQALAGAGLDQLSVRQPRGEPRSLRWILVHLIEEHARHAGHADLLRESIDGQVGD
jgi:uncharacterized damage-inducible protein DinB